MSNVKANTTLSYLQIELSKYCYDVFKKSRRILRANLQRLGKEVKRQILFLIHFTYTQENIKQHLLAKAGKFFGFDFDQKNVKKSKNNKPKKVRLRLKSRKSLPDIPQNKKGSHFKAGKKRKKMVNTFYRSPE